MIIYKIYKWPSICFIILNYSDSGMIEQFLRRGLQYNQFFFLFYQCTKIIDTLHVTWKFHSHFESFISYTYCFAIVVRYTMYVINNLFITIISIQISNWSKLSSLRSKRNSTYRGLNAINSDLNTRKSQLMSKICFDIFTYHSMAATK